MMNKEKLMQLFSDALDKNVNISFHFSQYQGIERHSVTIGEAKELINQFADALEITDIHHKVGNQHADHYEIDKGKFRVICAYIPSEEEKIAGKRKKIEDLKKELVELEKDEEVTA